MLRSDVLLEVLYIWEFELADGTFTIWTSFLVLNEILRVMTLPSTFIAFCLLRSRALLSMPVG